VVALNCIGTRPEQDVAKDRCAAHFSRLRVMVIPLRKTTHGTCPKLWKSPVRSHGLRTLPGKSLCDFPSRHVLPP